MAEDTIAEPDNPADAVWADVWNPEPNVWSPSQESYPAYGVDASTVQYQEHVDIHATPPMTESYGVPDDFGTVPAAGMNLLTDVRNAGTTPAPPQIVQHTVETYEQEPLIVRARTVHVTDTTVPVRLLDQNPNRKRALIKMITTTGVILIFPAKQGGVQGSGAIPSGNMAAYPIATGDPVHEVKSGAAVECVNAGNIAAVDVSVWEEVYAETHPEDYGLS